MIRNPNSINEKMREAIRGMASGIRDAVDFRKRLDAYRAVFEKTDRIITGRPVNVVVTEPPTPELQKAPGWTDGETVFLNGSQLQLDLDALRGKDITPLVMTLKGVNYHELSHVLYTPRLSDDICRKVIERAQADSDYRWWYSFNALEDQRIETWFTSMYRPASRYFEASALKWLVQNQGASSESHILVHGRKFLPAKVRNSARAAFEGKYGQALADNFAKVIDEYLTVAFPGDTNRAFMLVKKFHGLLRQARMLNVPDLLTQDNNPKNIPDKYDVNGVSVTKGRALHREQKKARDIAKPVIEKANQEAEDLRKQDQQNGSQPSTSNAEAGKSGDGDQGPGENQGTGTGDGPKNNVPTDTSGEAGIGSGVSTAQGDGIHTQDGVSAPDAKDVVDAMKDIYDALDEALNDPDLIEDVKVTANAIHAAQNGNNGNAQGKYMNGEERTASGDQKNMARRLEHVLRQLRLDLEPSWHRRQTQGRVNVRRFLTRQPWEVDVFDKWDSGSEEEGGVEVVMLLDQSGSMGQAIDSASQALWVLKAAFDKLGIRTTVLGYSDDHVVLYRPSDKVLPVTYRKFKTHNSTNPTTALREALHVLSASKHPNRVLITITDGQWGGKDAEILALVRAIQRQANATTLLLGLDRACSNYGRHGHELGRDITHVKELPDIASDLVATITRKVLARA